MTARTKRNPADIGSPVTQIEVPEPAVLPAERTGQIGDIVLYVMDDGVTIRPALIVAYITYTMHLSSGGRRAYGHYDLQVFVDGAYDNDIRGAHADATLTDFVTNVPLDSGTIDPRNPTAGPYYTPRTWHFRSLDNG